MEYNNDEIILEKIQKPHLSTIVDIKTQENLHGLAERIVAVESTVFLAKQYEFLQNYLENLIPPANKKILQQFYSQVSPKKTFNKVKYLRTTNLNMQNDR